MKYIYLSGEVSTWDYPGCISANQTRQLIADARAEDPAEPLTVVINSFGGDVTEGVAVYNLLRASRPVNIVISGIAASIASVIAMAGDHVAMYSNSSLYVHHAWSWAEGNASQMKQLTAELEAADRILIDAYVAKSGRTEEEIVALLDGPNGDGSSIDADSALELGLIDEILDPANAVAALLKKSTRQYTNRAGAQPGTNQVEDLSSKETAMSAEAIPATATPAAECGGTLQKNEEEVVEIEKEVKETSDDDDSKKRITELEKKVEELNSKLENSQKNLASAQQQVAAAAKFRQVNASVPQSQAEAQLSFPELVAKIGYVRARKEHPELMQAYIDAENAKGSIRDEARK